MRGQAPIRVLLVDDHELFREGIAEIFAAEDGMEVAGEAENGQKAIALAEREKPDVVLLDVEMPVMGAEEAIGRILEVSPSSRVVVLTMYDDPRLVQNLVTLGAYAYIVKSATREELLTAVRTVSRSRDRVLLSISRSTAKALDEGRKQKETLSSRELEILLLTARAMSNKQIASRLHISEGTVKRHLSNIYTKLEVSSRTDAGKKALASGLIAVRDL